MEVKNMFDPVVKQDIIKRINQLTAQSQPKWGKMNVSQMLAHCQMPIAIALGTHTSKGNPFMKLILPFFKSILYSEKPYKQGLPTDKSFVMTGTEKEFEAEKRKLLNILERFTEPTVVNQKHPAFGRLSKEQWSKATWKHLDHHLQQFGV